MTYLRKFCYLNSSCIRKSITLMFMSFSKNKIHAFVAKLGNRCFCWFPSVMLELIQVNNSMASLYYLNLYKWVKHFFGYLVYENIPLTWILARVFVYVPPFIFQILDFIYWKVLIFILIYFEWRDTENQQYSS